ncbi:hypothetical protein H310_07570 [Aphanomyces invadans]|uniref:Ubiquitin-like domain-containing protein n=1 Tax=Aphanomyces invadans TaxID=157072 RepID=A0A024U1R8_9STRA|nr:hypothetical protein H310_07570 [Aphanomyces invadans]ETW00165.1 hypothetical protein H310_07570 [Aphanomyces invadans]|eukprot:XP_008871190.1 hypothetical protein H310_07570 [Aphanomyces invadans]
MDHPDDLYVPTYDVQKSVAHLLDSSSDDDGDVHNVTPIKRRRVDQRPLQLSRAAASRGVARRISTGSDESSPPRQSATAPTNVIVLSSDEDDDNDVEMLRQVANDPEAIRFKELAMRSAAAAAAVISLDSDDEGVVQHVKPASSSAKASTIPLTVQWRSRAGAIETEAFTLRHTDSFQAVLDAVCAKLHVPLDAINMTFDGSPVLPCDTPETKDVEVGDQLDVVVNWDKVKPPQAAANAVRVRIQRTGSKKIQVFTIAPEMPVKKLLESYSAVHSLPSNAVVLKLYGEVLREDATIESYMLDGNDVLAAETSEAAEIADDDLNSVPITLRFSNGETEIHHIALAAKVETLVVRVSRKRHVEPAQIKLVVDGEVMNPQHPFHAYDLEGEEIIDVKLT